MLTPERRAFWLRVVRYGVAGLFATMVYAGAVLALVEWLGVRPVAAAALATVVVIFTSYVVNRKWVFDTDLSHRLSFARFAAASGVSIALNAGLMHLAVDILHWSYVMGVVVTTAIVPPVNFVMNYFWAFRAAGGSNNSV